MQNTWKYMEMDGKRSGVERRQAQRPAPSSDVNLGVVEEIHPKVGRIDSGVQVGGVQGAESRSESYTCGPMCAFRAKAMMGA
jgi:hypothetical protein